MLLTVDFFNTAYGVVAMQLKCIVFKKIAIIRPRSLEPVGVYAQFLRNAASEAAGTEYFNAGFVSGRIDGQAVGKSTAGVDPDLPVWGNRIFQVKGVMSGI
ncbi:hypothetical protein D3C87_1887330 [compost metagenome]